MSLVAPGLYVGDETSAASLEGLCSSGVTHILNCTTIANVHEGEPGAPIYRRLDLLDSVADLPRMQSALAVGVEFIREARAAGGVVLVHCHRGISRSSTLAIAYLVQANQQPAEVVFEQMRKIRPIIDPNLGYMMSLKEWERHVLPPTLLRLQRSLSRASSFGGDERPPVSGVGAASSGGPPAPVRLLSRSSSFGGVVPTIGRTNSLSSITSVRASTPPVRPLSRAG